MDNKLNTHLSAIGTPHQFKKGNKGRPKGSKDKSYLKLGFWFTELKKDWAKLTPNQRAHYSVELMKLLTNKMKSLPSDPSDSKFNADEAILMLRDVEMGAEVKEGAAPTGASPIAIPETDDTK